MLDFDDPDRTTSSAFATWVRGDLYPAPADIVGFVNGLPLLLIECEELHADSEGSRGKNTPNYRGFRTSSTTTQW